MIKDRRLLLACPKDLGEEVAFCPNDAMDGLAGRASNGADGKCFGNLLCVAIITLALALDDDLNLPVETRRATFDQRNVGRKAHFVDMSSRLQIVQCVEHQVESSEPLNVEVRIFDIGMMRFHLYVWIELGGALLRDLQTRLQSA